VYLCQFRFFSYTILTLVEGFKMDLLLFAPNLSRSRWIEVGLIQVHHFRRPFCLVFNNSWNMSEVDIVVQMRKSSAHAENA
jgi:hypothetical protein